MRFHYRHFTRIERGQDVCDTHFAKEQAFQTSLQRPFDWPAFLVMRKQARQSASYPHRSGGALNARNRIAAALRRSPPPRGDSVPLTDLVPGAQCFRSPPWPWRFRRESHFHRKSMHRLASNEATTRRKSNRSQIRAICASTKSSATPPILQSAQSHLHKLRLGKPAWRPILCEWVKG